MEMRVMRRGSRAVSRRGLIGGGGDGGGVRGGVQCSDGEWVGGWGLSRNHRGGEEDGLARANCEERSADYLDVAQHGAGSSCS